MTRQNQPTNETPCDDPREKYREFAASMQRFARAHMVSVSEVAAMLDRTHQVFDERAAKASECAKALEQVAHPETNPDEDA